MINRMSSSQIHMSSLDVILDAQARLQRTQEEMASGKRILSPSDDPVASSQIMQIQSELTRIETLQSNANRAASELAMVESSIANVESILMRARELAVRGGNASLSAQDREIVATEIDGLREQLIAAANTQDSSGNYIYSGYAVETKPYADGGLNATFSGDSGGRTITIASGLTVDVRVSGDALFGEGLAAAGDYNTFEALGFLSRALRADTSLDDYMTAIESNLENVRSVRTDIGVRMNRVEDQQALNDTFNLRLQETLSGLEDLDYTKAITEMNLQMVALEAAQKAYSASQKISLFNYL